MKTYLRAIITILLSAAFTNVNIAAQDRDSLCYELHNAAYKGDTVALAVLLSDTATDIECFFGGETNALGYAVQQGHYRAVELLLQYGANPNGQSEIFFTPLTLAADMGHLDVAELLILYGASTRYADNATLTPLLRAVYRNDYLMADMLLHYDSHPNTGMWDGTTPLIIASMYGYWDIAALLIEKGASPNLADNAGFTPMMAAAAFNDTLLGALLLHHNASVIDTNKAGWNALAYAIRGGSDEMAQMIRGRYQTDLTYELRKLLLTYRYFSGESLKRGNAINPGLKPFRGWFLPMWGMSFTRGEVMSGYSLGMKELRYDLMCTVGFEHRPGFSTVRYEPLNNDTIYRMFGKRYLVYLALEKQRHVLAINSGRIALVGGVKGGYTAGRFKGSEKRPFQQFVPVVYGGVSLDYKLFSCYLRYAYHPYRDKPLPVGKVEVGMGFRLTGKNYEPQLKQISNAFEL